MNSRQEEAPWKQTLPPDLVRRGQLKLTKNGERLILKPMKKRLLAGPDR